jgi:hypothetical protein
MKINSFLILTAGLFLFGCGKKEVPKSESPSSGNPVTAPADYLGAVSKAKKLAEKTVDTAGLQKSIDLFQAQEGRLPKNLNELVGPNYLSTLPAPPAGMKFDYNPATGQVKVVPQ